jgi:hypothetical protein
MNVLFISSLKKNSTAVSILRALLDFDKCKIHGIISDIDNQEFTGVKIKKGFFDIEKELDPEVDLILFVEGGSFQLFPYNIDKCPVITAWYGIDTHTNYNKHKEISKFFDFTFLAQKEYALKLSDDLKKDVFWLPLAYDQTCVINSSDLDISETYEIAYVGSMDASVHPFRMKLLKEVQKLKFNAFIGSTDSNKMYKIYNNSLVVFNYSINNDLNMRVFEAIGSGALLFTNPINNNGLEDFFIEGKDYFVYSESNFVQELISLREQLNEISRFRESRINKILNEHQYINRVELLFKVLTLQNKVSRITRESADSFDYMRIASLNQSPKIALKIYADELKAKTFSQKLFQFFIRKIL